MSNKTQALDWEEIYKKESGVLYGFISRKSNTEVANDILQETFMKVIQMSEKTKIMNVKAYLFKTARSLLIKFYKSNSMSNPQDSLEHIAEVNSSLHNSLEQKEIMKIIDIASKSLKDIELDVFEYRWYHGLSTLDIATIIDNSDRHVRRLLEKTSKTIKEALESQGYNLGEIL